MTVGTARRPANRNVTKRPVTAYGAGASNIDIRLVARSIAQATVEVLAGTRPIQQLSRSLDAECFLSLQHRAALTREHALRSRGAQHIHRSPMVRSVRTCSISETVYEAAIVVSEELRSRAIAMRLERRDDLWQVTALEIG
ncbi:Rv3235 family protein [Paenarthrobacter sp. NPDC089322]|uniref:Rv3235 family protein n=1 Tax=Paenarthrobacter sp. NPDC089322 TaxID=3155065 RepID=UPI0034499875